jgi:hypothetical protein
VVITATKWPTPRNYPAEAWKQHMTTRTRLQKELATRSARSKHIIANTEHHVQFENPRLVIDAVLRAVKGDR